MTKVNEQLVLVSGYPLQLKNLISISIDLLFLFVLKNKLVVEFYGLMALNFN